MNIQELINDGTQLRIWTYENVNQVVEIMQLETTEEALNHLKELIDYTIDNDPDYSDNAKQLKNKYFGGK